LHQYLLFDYNDICLNPNSHKPQGQRGARTVSRFKTKEWVFDLRKLALILMVLLFAGIVLTLGQAGHNTGNCTCPSNTTCSQSACVVNCGSLCAHNTSLNSSATVAFQCGSNCPMKMCGTAGNCKACCGPKCAACCGKVQ